MRIKADYYNNFGGGPCASSAETETQDYAIIVTGSPPGSVSGVVNSYQPVTGICFSRFDVPTPSTFAAGDKVLLIQMRGATIDVSGTLTYGDVTAMNTSGKYEFLTISSVTGNSVITSANPQFNYDVTGQVQLIKVAQYAGPTTTVTAGGITCPAWNGATGGIIVIEDNCESLGSIHSGKKLGNLV